VTPDCDDAGCEAPLPALVADELGAEVDEDEEDEQAVAATSIKGIAAASWSNLRVVAISAVSPSAASVPRQVPAGLPL
jgi:hypothetical protein